jgi:hypothetical protein
MEASMPSDKKYGPSIPITRLFERVSKSGNHYLTGRLGAAKIAVLKSNEITDDGMPIWNVVLSEPPADKRPRESRELSYTAIDPEDASGPPPDSRRRPGGFDRGTDDEIPF